MTVKAGSYEWHEKVAELLEAVGGPAAAQRLQETLSSLLAMDSFIVFRYRYYDVPEILYDNVSHARRQNNLDNYLDGAYLLDPFYQYFLEDRGPGVVPLKQAGPDHFLKSEYYRTYYKFSGLRDEVNIFLRLSDSVYIVLAMGRSKGRGRFGKQDLQHLENILPIIQLFCRRQWGTEVLATSAAPASDNYNSRFLAALKNFGASCLSKKEREVLNLLLMGHSGKSTAERMKISLGTVKIHRNNIYSKLDIRSQSELFSLFIGAVAAMTGDGTEDPLVAYHAKPPLAEKKFL
ncbi:helix-turn-helix domain-containing protein [Paremcibacter congregatus]|uniref:HTH luxR-type domain-containing protein n=1 Tax=Paremcibacter congregatus TaxID=2043170 RepID=A0A2G4YWI1_9PROT|nr:helix-turn-helix transcriptional regulator [Paremcibacter congregatus]PHZ86610.1 hypothetical protein CRD36_01650 [Paremcibacter congregatus]QDE26412.1 helix-turn-helix transcriptional regulator [Paremcibacter congregatus]